MYTPHEITEIGGHFRNGYAHRYFEISGAQAEYAKNFTIFIQTKQYVAWILSSVC